MWPEGELPERSSVRLGLKICAAMVDAAGWVVRTTPKEALCRSEQVQAIGSTAEWTSRRRPCRDDEEHIDQVVVDNLAWEERGFPVGVSAAVEFARNDHMGLTIPYSTWRRSCV